MPTIQEKKAQTSIVICAYNEQKTIQDVVSKCHRFNPESEIVVVDDGSTDQTHQILTRLNEEIPFRYIRLSQNQGKSNAMVVGVEEAKKDIIMFFDADVSGIKEKHFEELLSPLDQEADMVLGSPSETLIDYRVNPFKSLTGERTLYKKDIEPILENIRDIRFGVETYMNLYFQAHGKKVKYLLLEGLTHPTKYKKTTPKAATTEFVSEGKEIAMTLLKNYDLITQRITNSFEEKGDNFRTSMRKIQKDLNDKIQVLLGNNG